MSKVIKIKPIRFDDTWNHEEKRLADGVVEVRSTFLYDNAEHGRSYYVVRCGFCQDTFRAYKWSLRGGGKRCPSCKALMGSTGQTFQWIALVKEQSQ